MYPKDHGKHQKSMIIYLKKTTPINSTKIITPFDKTAQKILVDR